MAALSCVCTTTLDQPRHTDCCRCAGTTQPSASSVCKPEAAGESANSAPAGHSLFISFASIVTVRCSVCVCFVFCAGVALCTQNVACLYTRTTRSSGLVEEFDMRSSSASMSDSLCCALGILVLKQAAQGRSCSGGAWRRCCAAMGQRVTQSALHETCINMELGGGVRVFSLLAVAAVPSSLKMVI